MALKGVCDVEGELVIPALANSGFERCYLALSAHTPRVQVSVHTARVCWHSELGFDTPSRYLASAGTPVKKKHYKLRFCTLMR